MGRGAEQELPQVRVQFQYERTEYVRGIRYYLRKSHTVSWVQAVALVVALAAMGVVAAVQWPGPLSLFQTFVSVLLLLAALYGLYLYFDKPGRLFDRDPSLARPVVFLFSREDIARQDGETAALLEWEVRRFWRGKEFYFLFPRQGPYLMLPRRAFSGREAEKNLERLVLAANPGVVFRQLD